MQSSFVVLIPQYHRNHSLSEIMIVITKVVPWGAELM